MEWKRWMNFEILEWCIWGTIDKVTECYHKCWLAVHIKVESLFFVLSQKCKIVLQRLRYFLPYILINNSRWINPLENHEQACMIKHAVWKIFASLETYKSWYYYHKFNAKLKKNESSCFYWLLANYKLYPTSLIIHSFLILRHHVFIRHYRWTLRYKKQ